MGKILFDEPPLIVIPSLATKIGLNESIIIQQLHYWIEKSEHVYDNRRWIYNTYVDWKKQFPFWSERTIKRTIYSLEDSGILLTGNYNKAGFDNTKWYSINYDQLNLVARPSGQSGTTDVPKCHGASGQSDPTNTRDYTETTSETTKKTLSFCLQDDGTHTEDIKKIIDYLNKRTGKNFKANAQDNKRHINARFADGFTLEQFFYVIDLKTEKWLNNPDHNVHLRPRTLFGPKMQDYVNEQRVVVKGQQKNDFAEYEAMTHGHDDLF